ncbi:MAG TPA: outer membrane beta-barrel protein [Burkholderiales bacterium]|nr:outer membrane beta-barrel protein [Burkholderiales bacterium]
MHRCVLRAAWLLLAAPLMAPVSAFAFEAVDVLTPADSGVYPAYPSEPLPPYNLWGQFGMMYDSNILRRTTGDNHELLTRLGIGGRYDQRIVGRQSLHAEGRVDSYVYNQYSDLDNIGYGGLAEWRYEVGNDLSGAIGVSRRRFQANLSEIQRAAYDPITETQFSANGRYVLGPHLGARAGAAFIDYVRPSRADSNTKTTIVTGGIDWTTQLGNVLGLEYAQARGNAPVNQLVDPLGVFVNNDYTQRDVGVVATWAVGPTMRLAGRYGQTHREYSELPGRNFDGPTYDALFQWLPGNKTMFTVETEKHISSIIDIGASHVTVTGFAFGPGWAPTAKLNFQARFLKQHQVFAGDPEAQLGVAPLREEYVRGYRLGAYWEMTRQVHFQFSIDHGERESNILGRNYSYNAGIANVRYVF